MANPRGNPDQGARNASGRYVRTPENAARDAEAARLHSHGYTDRMLMQMLGFPSINAVKAARKKIMDEIVQAPAAEIIQGEVRKLDMELMRLEQLERNVRKVLDAEHITVSNGHVILDPRTEQPLADDAPILQAADRLVKIEDARRKNAARRAALLGLDAEQKVSVEGTVRYEVVGVSVEDLK